MRDPRAILSQAQQGAAASNWVVFTKGRGLVRGFLRGTSDDPDPLLVITPEGIVEYVDHRKGLQVVDFDRLSEITLKVQGHSFSDSMIVTLDVWLDFRFHDGRQQKWRSSAFAFPEPRRGLALGRLTAIIQKMGSERSRRATASP
jgi:hypothetical protein